MNPEALQFCPGTLAAGYHTYSRTCLNRLFSGKKVHHVLPYDAPSTDDQEDYVFAANQKLVSISGVQEKYSIIQDKNKLRLAKVGEQGTHILKPIPRFGKNSGEMPANEHLTMQIARQVFGIETAENALVFFKNGQPAYITKRFDLRDDGSKWAAEDFASLAGRTPQTHGANYKYEGNYLELFGIMKKYLPAWKPEAVRLFKLLVFNYLFSNGDAHLKNFSLLETPMGDFRLSPAYDLLNSRMHIDDADFALNEGLLPRSAPQGKVTEKFILLGELAGIPSSQVNSVFRTLLSGTEKVKSLINASFLTERSKRSYLQSYQTRLKKLGGE